MEYKLNIIKFKKKDKKTVQLLTTLRHTNHSSNIGKSNKNKNRTESSDPLTNEQCEFCTHRSCLNNICCISNNRKQKTKEKHRC